MRSDPSPAAPVRDIVLVGGGHTHVQVLTAFAERPVDGVRLTLVSRDPDTPYSGMLPGHIAGLYSREAIHIQLQDLSLTCGNHFIIGTASGLDRRARAVVLSDGRRIPYDLVSLDVGITPDLSRIDGAADHIIAVKPISRFLGRFAEVCASVLEPGGPRRIAIVGGGPAGVELALAIGVRLRAALAAAGQPSGDLAVRLITAGAVVPGLSPGFRRRVERALGAAGVTVTRHARVGAADAAGVTTTDGRRIAADVVFAATLARAPGFLAGLGLPTADDGSILTAPTLQSLGDDRVFAVGDCAVVADDPREKAGVYAVRQGPVLARNLRAAALGAPPERYRAQRSHLVLVATADGRAIGGRGRWPSFEGRWVWWLKDAIDRSFMRRFQAP